LKTAIAIRHVAFEDLGSFAGELHDQGYHLHYFDAAAGIPGQAGMEADLLVVLGGPIGAYDEADYPFLKEELRLLAHRLQHGLPTLGICLGAQLMARALGARVYPGAVKEIGWKEITLTEAGVHSVLAPLQGIPVLHWHGDTFDLPAGAVRLASSDLYENQAFAHGEHALALQFHPEVTEAGLEHWLIGHAAEINATPGVTVAGLRADVQRYGAALAPRGRLCLADWLRRQHP
jgi:GMP synthase (glutamine-hydrolysing)